MKKLVILLSVFFATSVAGAATGQSTSRVPKTNSNGYRIGLNAEPHWLILGGFGAKLDVGITRSISLGVGGIVVPEHSSTSSSDSDVTYESYKWSYNEIYAGPTFMLTGDLTTHGLYLSPGVGIVQSKISDYSSFKLSGELRTPFVRTTVGYQWRIGALRFAVGGGFRAMQASEVVVKDESGKEVHRGKSTSLGGVAFDGQIGFVF